MTVALPPSPFEPSRRAAMPRSGADCLSVDAIVIGVDRAGLVELEVGRAQGCKGCNGLCLWRGLPERGRERYWSDPGTDCALEAGEAVSLQLPARALLRGSLLLYGLPLAALLGGGAAGQWLLGSDAGCLLGAFSGVVLMLAAGTRLARAAERAALAEIRLARRCG